MHNYTISKDLAERLKQIRAHKNLSQKEVALTVGIDRAQYSRFESGKADPSLPTLKKIAAALEVKIADLFTEEEGYEVNSANKPLMEKMKLIEELSEEDQKTIFNILDAFLGKKKLKDTLSNVLQDVA